jgi:hypothetical protein
VANLQRLRGAGFSAHAVRAVPLVLCHHPAVLQRHLEMLRRRRELRVVETEGTGQMRAGLVSVKAETKEVGPETVKSERVGIVGVGCNETGLLGAESIEWAGLKEEELVGAESKGVESKGVGPERALSKKAELVWAGPTEQELNEWMEPAGSEDTEHEGVGLWAKGILADEVKLLNALQFFIERETNFQLPVVIHDGKELTDNDSELVAKSEQCLSSEDMEDYDSHSDEEDCEDCSDDNHLQSDQDSAQFMTED